MGWDAEYSKTSFHKRERKVISQIGELAATYSLSSAGYSLLANRTEQTACLFQMAGAVTETGLEGATLGSRVGLDTAQHAL